jgi:hypothetical protein
MILLVQLSSGSMLDRKAPCFPFTRFQDRGRASFIPEADLLLGKQRQEAPSGRRNSQSQTEIAACGPMMFPLQPFSRSRGMCTVGSHTLE